MNNKKIFRPIMVNIDDSLKQIIMAFVLEGCRVFLVGGCVRDGIIGKKNKDIDLEIYFPLNVNPEEKMVEILSRFGEVDLVGKQFGAYKLHGFDVDFCLPRIETKVGKGHKGFVVSFSTTQSENEEERTLIACIRRDLTINAILQDAVTGEIIDHFGGLKDLENGIIRIVDEKTFIEDPLRVLRIAQFLARFHFRVEENTLELCKKIVANGDMNDLPSERIFEEFNKMLLKSSKPSLGFEFLREIGYLPVELQNLIGCFQRPDAHPEGDVWNHTMMVIDKMASLREYADNKLVAMYGAICHDMGKPSVTDNEGKAHGHDDAGVLIAKTYLNRITNNTEINEGVEKIVQYHMKPVQLYNQNVSDSAIIRLQLKLGNKLSFKDLLLFAQADYEGRGSNKSFAPIKEWYDEKLDRIGHTPPPKIVNGNDIKELLNLKQGKIIGEILSFAYSLQIEGNTDKQYLLDKIKEKYSA